MTVTLVTMIHPCSACQMIDCLMRDLFDSMKDTNPGVMFQVVVLNHPSELSSIEGLNEKNLPAVLIDGEQITAGTLLHRRQLEDHIQKRLKKASH